MDASSAPPGRRTGPRLNHSCRDLENDDATPVATMGGGTSASCVARPPESACMTLTATSDRPSPPPVPCTDATDLAVLDAIAQRVLWLATRIVDVANRERGDAGGIKVGGHQASSASMVSIMTALWFDHLEGEDLVSVKPHASPVLHAIHHLMGQLDRSYLTKLRARGGLQAYPSRTKDPDRVDFSTGSVGLGAAAPLFAAATRRYVDAHFGPRPPSRFVSLLGDAELDEGNIWEAIADPATEGLGSVMWVVDFNRQSLDRVIPGVRIDQWEAQFRAAGWHVVEVKYGSLLQEAFERPGGAVLRRWLDAMSNEQYQSLFALHGPQLRARFLQGAPEGVGTLVADLDDDTLRRLVTNLGGHDLERLLAAFRACDAETERPSVVFAYTVKGWGLPMAGNPRNHGALLSGEEIDALRAQVGLSVANEWDRFPDDTPEGRLSTARGSLFGPRPTAEAVALPVPPTSTGTLSSRRPVSSQETFGRVLTSLSRDEAVGRHLVSTAPDVATTTHLAGFVNRAGVFSPQERPNWSDDPMLRWEEGPQGQHIELGISEMNFFLLLGQLGLAGDLSGQRLLPIGTVYDPFVLRGLDAFVYAAYSGARFLLAGTPSGVTLAPEGGAHQSTITASVGLELPGVTLIEPAYAQSIDWLICDALRRLAAPASPGSVTELIHYFRLSTRPLDQSPFEAARSRLGDAVLRRQVLAGAYRLHDAAELAEAGAPVVNLAASGAIMPEVLSAAAELADEGVAAHVVDVTSASRLYRDWRDSIRTSVRTARIRSRPGTLHGPFQHGAPVVSVHDASSHALAWLGAALGVPGVALGVDEFGQSGTIDDLYHIHDIDPGSIVNAALSTLS